MIKKIILILIILCSPHLGCCAQDSITFLYLNGSNTNDQSTYEWYTNGIKKLHPLMKSNFEKSEIIQKTFLKDGLYAIEQEPAVFYWGDKSAQQLEFVKSSLNITKGISPWLAYKVREILATCLHDAIWVQKHKNMEVILNNLHEQVKKQTDAGKQVVLFGYSAGSFVTTEYLFARTPYIKVQTFFAEHANVPEKEKAYAAKHPMQDTCVDALTSVMQHDDFGLFVENYDKLDTTTKDMCAPKGSLRGIVNYASPLVLFYSDLASKDYELTYFRRLIYEYIIENDIFWLTVNYREDPLGFPASKNLTPKDVGELIGAKISDSGRGFVYSDSETSAHRTFAGAHMSYWSTSKNFAKAVVKNYEKAFEFNYEDE